MQTVLFVHVPLQYKCLSDWMYLKSGLFLKRSSTPCLQPPGKTPVLYSREKLTEDVAFSTLNAKGRPALQKVVCGGFGAALVPPHGERSQTQPQTQ